MHNNTAFTPGVAGARTGRGASVILAILGLALAACEATKQLIEGDVKRSKR